jgi:hypothetical protein
MSTPNVNDVMAAAALKSAPVPQGPVTGNSNVSIDIQAMLAQLRAEQEQQKTAFQAELDKLKAENERLKARSMGTITPKVSSKGGMSVYGLGKFPVTLYKEQWARLLSDATVKILKDFLADNNDKLHAKGDGTGDVEKSSK